MNKYNSHLPLLLYAAKETDGAIVELGAGEGSTEKLSSICAFMNRGFYSYENNKEYAEKYGSTLITSWDDVPLQKCGLLFVDHAPGDRRKVDIQRWRNHADVIVVHDTEMSADYGYKMSTVLDSFKYRIDHHVKGFARTTLVSDYVDLLNN